MTHALPKGICGSCGAEKILAVYTLPTGQGYCAECVGLLDVCAARIASEVERATLLQILDAKITGMPSVVALDTSMKDEDYWRRTLGEDAQEADHLPPPTDRRLSGETPGQYRARLARARTRENVRRRPPRVVR